MRRFNLRGKLHLRCIGPYESIDKLNIVAYRLHFPTKLEHVHNVFHISQLRKYVPNSNHVIITEPEEVIENLMYEVRPIQILDYRAKQLQNKSIPLVKVLWVNHASSEAIWETEQDIKSKCPYLFEVQLRFLLNLQVSMTKLILRGKVVTTRT